MRSRPNRKQRLDRGHRSPSIYSRTEKVKEKKSFKFLYILFFLLIITGICYLLFFAPYVRLNNFEIQGTKYTNIENLQKRAGEYRNSFIINNNLITIYLPGLKNRLEKVEGVKNITLKKKFPNTIIVGVEESIPSLTWQTQEKKYFIDENGVLFASFDEKFKDVPVVIDSKNVPVEIGRVIVSPTFCRFVNQIAKSFEISSGTKIKTIEVPEITEEIRVTTVGGWYVLFDTTRTADGELSSLSRVVGEVKAKKKKLEYVDLRIDNKIFYK